MTDQNPSTKTHRRQGGHAVILILVLFVLVAASIVQAAADPRGEGTIKMAAMLKEAASRNDPAKNPFLSRERIAPIRKLLAAEKDPTQRKRLQFDLALQLMNSNENNEAIRLYVELEKSLEGDSSEAAKSNRSLIGVNLAVCWLRVGELENCVTNHTTESCLVPIRAGGVHRLTRGSNEATKVLTKLLSSEPDNLSARWLLNIAAMTLGNYPLGVPERWRIPESAFASGYDIGRFTDVAGAAGLDENKLSGGAIVDDFDNDGLLDLVTSSIGFSDQLRFKHNNGDGTFEDRTERAGLVGLTGGLNMIQADFDNDGHLDFLVLRGGWMRSEGKFPKSLIRNRGDGTFEDVTIKAGVLSVAPSQTAVWADFDNDGWVDLFIGNESTGADAHPCQLFRNNHDGTFTDIAPSAGVAFTGFVKGVAAGDYNNDGRTDIYLSMLKRGNVLFRNEGTSGMDGSGKPGLRFTSVAGAARVTEPTDSFPTWFFDYDNDGWEDLFVSGYRITDVGDVCADYLGLPNRAEKARLYRNNRDGTFKDVTRETGLYRVLHAMGSNFGDLDNDGFLDFYLGTGDPDLATLVPNRMFRNDAGKKFQDVTTSGGFGHLQKGHAVVFADINNDGNEDVFENMGGAVSGDVYRNVLYKNPGHSNNWVTLKLEGVKSNRSAIGARVRVVVSTSEGPREIHRTVNSGGSFGANPLRREIGLGQAMAIERVEIRWPASGITQTITNVAMNRFHLIREGASSTEPLAAPKFQLRTTPAGEPLQHH